MKKKTSKKRKRRERSRFMSHDLEKISLRRFIFRFIIEREIPMKYYFINSIQEFKTYHFSLN